MNDPMTHADTLRSMAHGPHPGLSRSGVLALTAGADALQEMGRVRNVLNGLIHQKAESEHARDHGYDNPDWHETNADTLQYVIDLLTEALEGGTK